MSPTAGAALAAAAWWAASGATAVPALAALSPLINNLSRATRSSSTSSTSDTIIHSRSNNWTISSNSQDYHPNNSSNSKDAMPNHHGHYTTPSRGVVTAAVVVVKKRTVAVGAVEEGEILSSLMARIGMEITATVNLVEVAEVQQVTLLP